MQFDWTTFALEIVNFLVLAWILQRFLYRPVTAVIARRGAEIANRLTEAQTARAEAQALKLQYEGSAADSRRDRDAARAKLQEDIVAEGTRLREGLNASLEAEREKLRASERQRLSELRRQARNDAEGMAGEFLARLLSRLACAQLETKICQIVIEDLGHLSERDAKAIRAAAQASDAKARVATVYMLGQTERHALAQALSRVAEGPVACDFLQDEELIAGLRITLGSWVVGANLKDEMRMFVEAMRDAE